MTKVTDGRQIQDVIINDIAGNPVSTATVPSKWSTCTPSDATDLATSVGLYIGVGGNVSARLVSDPTVTVVFANLPSGVFVPGRFTRVMAATTASSILVGYP